MITLADLVRECSNCPPGLARLSDDEIVDILGTKVDGMRLADVLLDVGCEVVVEWIVENVLEGAEWPGKT